MRFGIPPGLERNTANWNKVTSATQGVLTQIRGSVKKEVCTFVVVSLYDHSPMSVQIKKSVEGIDKTSHSNIFTLTEKILAGTGCQMTVPIMARVALMVRAAYISSTGPLQC